MASGERARRHGFRFLSPSFRVVHGLHGIFCHSPSDMRGMKQLILSLVLHTCSPIFWPRFRSSSLRILLFLGQHDFSVMRCVCPGHASSFWARSFMLSTLGHSNDSVIRPFFSSIANTRNIFIPEQTPWPYISNGPSQGLPSHVAHYPSSSTNTFTIQQIYMDTKGKEIRKKIEIEL